MLAEKGILIALPMDGDLESLCCCLSDNGYADVTQNVSDFGELTRAVSHESWSAVIVPKRCKNFTAMDVLDLLKDRAPTLPLIVIADDILADEAVSLMKAGAADVIDIKQQDKLIPALQKARASHQSRRHHQDHSVNHYLAAAVFRSASEAIIVTDAEKRIQAVNPAFSRVTGYHPEEAIGLGCDFCRSDQQVTSVLQDRNQVLRERGAWQGETWLRRKNGEDFPAWSSVTTIRNNGGQITEYVTILSDITERKRDQEKIWHQAHYDSLTGLANRSHFFERLPHSINLAARENRSVALLFLDLDYFKIVNDTLGHRYGDELLKQASQRMLNVVRDTDMVARIGGDEFAIMLSSAVDGDAARQVARKLLNALSDPFDLIGQEAYISASIGISIFPDHTDNVDDLLNMADRAMYTTKSEGRNGFTFYYPELSEIPLVKSTGVKIIARPVKKDQQTEGLGIYSVPVMEEKEPAKPASWLKPGIMFCSAVLVVLTMTLVTIGLMNDGAVTQTVTTDLDEKLGGELMDLDTAAGPSELGSK